MGAVVVVDKVVQFTRPGLTEEYSVSADGVRQDFVVTERPAGAGELRVELGLSGARAEVAVYGAKLRLEGSGRELAYSRLRAVDATGKELSARMEVVSADRLAVRVEDRNATYPVRIDPTFSDANWISMGGITGADQGVWAAAADASGNLYIGGGFTLAGHVVAKYIAKWDGTNWSALGSGLDGEVNALAVSGSNVYAGGDFTNAGGIRSITLPNGMGAVGRPSVQAWTTLCAALAVSGSDVYVGGDFTTATTRGRQNGQLHCQMGREHLVAVGLGVGGRRLPLCRRACCFGQRRLCGRQFRHPHQRRRKRWYRQLHRQMGREQLVGARLWDGQLGIGAGGIGQRPLRGRLVYHSHQ